MSRRLAPTLSEDVKRRHMTESGKACRVGDCGRCHRGAAELRALLALARAVHRFEVSDTEYEPVTAAYNRLRKVSGKKP
jgi:hypothetical protein